MYSYTFVTVISRSVSPESVHRFPFAEGIHASRDLSVGGNTCPRKATFRTNKSAYYIKYY